MPVESTPESLLGADLIEGLAPAPELGVNVHRALERTAIGATLWTVIAYGMTQAIRLGNNLILTRLLVPQYFGLMALATTLVMGMALLSDIGLLPSVIVSPRGNEPTFLNTAWTLQIIRGCALWMVATALAFPLSVFYGDARIRFILPVLAISMILSGFASTNLMKAARNINVRRLLVIDLITQLFGIAVMLAWAWTWPSVWALVAGTLAASGTKTVLSHIPAVLPGERNSFAWDRSALHGLVHFGKWIMLGTAFYFFATQADRLFLGKLVTFTLLGVYNIAFTIADIPRQVMLQFSSRVGFPFVSRLTHLPPPEFRRKVMRYRFYLLCAGALLLSVVILAGGPLVHNLYDKRYAAATWMVPILALGLWHTLLYSTISDVIFALGKPIYNAIGTACYCATIMVALPLAFHFYGMRGAVISIAASDFPVYIVFGVGASKLKVSLWRQDGLATIIFLTVLAIGFLVRRLIS